MIANQKTNVFSIDIVDDMLMYATLFRKPCGFIVIVLDHMSEHQGHIENLMAHLYPLLKKNIRATDSVIPLSPDSWLICFDDCNERLLEWGQYVLQSLLNRYSTQINSPLNNIMSLTRGSLLLNKTFLQAKETIESEVQIAKAKLRRLKMIRSTALSSSETGQENTTDFSSFIHQSLVENRLFLAFQPIVSTQNGDIQYYECLARILDHDRQILGAGQFIGSCEKLGIIQLIDQKMQQLALEELMSDRDLRLAINVSAVTATDPVWLNTLKAQLTSRPDIKGRLIVELTETSVFYDIEESIAFITQLRELGCQVSIDDFGAGYVSLMHLKSDLVQIVKIDAQFVTGLTPVSDNIHFIRAIVALTQNQGIKCVAEGVEDAVTKETLIDEKVHYLQGYYTGKPSPVRKWL